MINFDYFIFALFSPLPFRHFAAIDTIASASMLHCRCHDSDAEGDSFRLPSAASYATLADAELASWH
jgi:hypothetical protein